MADGDRHIGFMVIAGNLITTYSSLSNLDKFIKPVGGKENGVLQKC